MPEVNILETLIQAGAVGIALFALWIIWKLVTNHDQHLLDALNRNTDAFNKTTEVLQKVVDKIDFLIK